MDRASFRITTRIVEEGNHLFSPVSCVIYIIANVCMGWFVTKSIGVTLLLTHQFMRASHRKPKKVPDMDSITRWHNKARAAESPSLWQWQLRLRLQPTSSQAVAPSVPAGHLVPGPGGGVSTNTNVQGLKTEVAVTSPSDGEIRF